MLLFYFLIVFCLGQVDCGINQYWDPSLYNCKDCPSECLTCYSPDYCTSCNEANGFYMDTDYHCVNRITTHCAVFEGLYCLECELGYYTYEMECLPCKLANCNYCKPDKCLQCKEPLILYEYLDENDIEHQECVDCEDDNNDEKCGRCDLGYYFNITKFRCMECRDNCNICTEYNNCYQCSTDLALENPNDPLSKCVKLEGCIPGTYYGNHCYDCDVGYYLQEGYCYKCKIQNCSICANDTNCEQCYEPYILINNHCITDEHCLEVSEMFGCIECEDKYYVNSNTLCQLCPPQCYSCLNETYCFECADDYYFSDLDNGVCTKRNERICNVVDEYGCLQCANDVLYDESIDKLGNSEYIGFYIGFYTPIIKYTKGNDVTPPEIIYEKECKMCNPLCRRCEFNESWCTACNEGYSIEQDDYATAQYKEIFGDIKTIFKCVPKPDVCNKTDMGYCIECIDQYFLSKVNCIQCDISCSSCISDKYCLTCNETKINGTNNNRYWRNPSYNFKEENEKGFCYDLLEPNSTNKYHLNCLGDITTSGCTSCKNGYYFYDGECFNCPINCYNCEGLSNITEDAKCIECKPEIEYLSDSICYNCTNIPFCVKCNIRGCEQCEDSYTLSTNRLECTKINLALILPLVIVGLFVLIIIIIIIIIILLIRRKRVMKEREKEIKPFKVSSAVEMELLSADNTKFPLKTDKWQLNFGMAGQKVSIDKEYEEVINISNTTKKSYFFEILLGNSHRYELVAEPMRYTLKPGFAIEVKFTIKMLCTAIVRDDIGIIAMDMDEELKETAKVTVLIESDLSTKLDHTELELQLPAIGEGAFGMVFKGTYRKTTNVAVKKMKARTLTEEQEKEFKHEVNMLTQFRHHCVVNFIGAVYTEGEVSIITEYAEYGSMIKLFGIGKVTFDLKIKILEDIVVALSYLHDNTVIHRDVKGENVLVYSLNPHSSVCGKLTDFGTCRNISERSLATKPLSFGIGTPTYMSPESLANTDYSYPSDVYSFGIVLFETFTEKQAYINDPEFDQPWKIPQFVIEGKRLPKPVGIPENCWDLINKCWDHHASNRPDFKSILSTLISWGLDITHSDPSFK